jgi:predicted transcriptional regulator
MGARKIQITLPEEMAERLADKARDYNRTEADLATEAVQMFIESDDDFIAAVNEGIAQVEAGEYVAHEDVEAWLLSLRTANPLPMPLPKRK